MNEAETKAVLEDAWHRWLSSCDYAQEHKGLQFFKKFCKYTVLIWMKADADAQLLQQMFLGSSVFSSSITPAEDTRMHYWADNLGHDLYSILETNDVGIEDDLATFLYEEYIIMMHKLAVPLTLQQAAQKKLPEKHFSDTWIALQSGDVEAPSGLIFPGDTMKKYVTEVEEVPLDDRQ